MILNTSKTLLCFERVGEFFGNVLSIFNITEHTVLVQAVYVKWVSWESFYISYTLDKTHLETKNVILMTAIQQEADKMIKVFK